MAMSSAWPRWPVPWTPIDSGSSPGTGDPAFQHRHALRLVPLNWTSGEVLAKRYAKKEPDVTREGQSAAFRA